MSMHDVNIMYKADIKHEYFEYGRRIGEKIQFIHILRNNLQNMKAIKNAEKF